MKTCGCCCRDCCGKSCECECHDDYEDDDDYEATYKAIKNFMPEATHEEIKEYAKIHLRNGK